MMPGQAVEAAGRPGMQAPVLRWRQAFPGDQAQISALRRWLEQLLPSCPSRDDVVSVTVELCTNAVCHTASGQGGQFAVEVTWAARIVRVAVFDGGAACAPKVIEDPQRDDGRGLVMVNALSVRRGFTGDARGRVVWADVLWAGPGVPGQPRFPEGFVSAIGEAGAELARRYPGVLIWFGCETWQWWALPLRRGPGALVAASSAQELAQLLDAMEAARRSPPAAGLDISDAQVGRRPQRSTAARLRIEPVTGAIRSEARACLLLLLPSSARTAFS